MAAVNQSAFEGRRVLITGGLGFIGSNLARRLVTLGARVLLVDSLVPEYGGNPFNISGLEDRVTVNIADVRDEHGMRWLVQKQDYIFNLAGQTSHLDSMRDPYTDLEINCRAQLSILEACRKQNPSVKLVFASTRQIYGSPQYLPVDEKHPLKPVDVNGINKLSGEMFHVLYHEVYGLRATALRLTNTYGPRMRVRDDRQTFLGIWIRRLLEGASIDVFGDGTQRRDFTYVDDVVEAFLLVAADDRANGQVFNLGGTPPVALKDLAEKLVALAGTGSFRIVPFPAERKKIDIGDYYGDTKKVHAAVGWEPRTSLDDGLRATLAFYRENGRHYWD
jgi:UDP-glucose 4-epimerase